VREVELAAACARRRWRGGRISFGWAFFQKHRVAVAEEAVGSLTALGVAARMASQPGERGDQQSAAWIWGMEVGDERIDHPEAIARVMKISVSPDPCVQFRPIVPRLPARAGWWCPPHHAGRRGRAFRHRRHAAIRIV